MTIVRWFVKELTSIYKPRRGVTMPWQYFFIRVSQNGWQDPIASFVMSVDIYLVDNNNTHLEFFIQLYIYLVDFN